MPSTELSNINSAKLLDININRFNFTNEADPQRTIPDGCTNLQKAAELFFPPVSKTFKRNIRHRLHEPMILGDWNTDDFDGVRFPEICLAENTSNHYYNEEYFSSTERLVPSVQQRTIPDACTNLEKVAEIFFPPVSKTFTRNLRHRLHEPMILGDWNTDDFDGILFADVPSVVDNSNRYHNREIFPSTKKPDPSIPQRTIPDGCANLQKAAEIFFPPVIKTSKRNLRYYLNELMILSNWVPDDFGGLRSMDISSAVDNSNHLYDEAT